ncbi:glutathione synthetase ATP-binding domain-like protein [Myriangium duriaei CBS 260.36]|uniref:Glutathione synthetase ATP-binding domain-like protein n=1 Tax=Myriangium duriaei CBS 260.36 TaxID=1168546 RepID=A0A9P4IWE7_9PEZI|nr:glutathione synthetase ATP-binding domain-like protein [Myriangium duriaei CBS 260.36]
MASSSPTTPSEPPLVLLATCTLFPHGEAGAANLTSALSRRGLTARWESWTDTSVPWSSAALVVVRSTWDYTDHLSAFLGWAGNLSGPEGNLLHSDRAFGWNTNKRYLLELSARGVGVVPTVYARTVEEVRAALSEGVGEGMGGRKVVKPAVGVNGFGVEVVDAVEMGWRPVWEGPWVVQPFLASVETEGELGVVIIDGKVKAGVRKSPKEGGWMVNLDYGGRFERVEVGEEAERVALRAWDVVEELLGVRLGYARVDLLRYEDRLVVSEVEITEPSMYFDIMPELAEEFADMVVRRIKARKV